MEDEIKCYGVSDIWPHTNYNIMIMHWTLYWSNIWSNHQLHIHFVTMLPFFKKVADRIVRPWHQRLRGDVCDRWPITSRRLECRQTVSLYRYRDQLRVNFRDIIIPIMNFILKTISTNIRVWIMNSKWSRSTKELFGLFRRGVRTVCPIWTFRTVRCSYCSIGLNYFYLNSPNTQTLTVHI